MNVTGSIEIKKSCKNTRKNTSASTTRYQDVNLEQEEVMKMDNVDMGTQECAYISRQEDVKREIIVIFTMEERASTIQVKTSTSPEILMETSETTQMLGL